jgi:hypothetical protein
MTLAVDTGMIAEPQSVSGKGLTDDAPRGFEFRLSCIYNREQK